MYVSIDAHLMLHEALFTCQQGDTWLWGSESENENGNRFNQATKLSTLPLTSNYDNPCEVQKLRQPNFNVSGRRISESKCYEYIWKIREREFYQNQELFCSGRDQPASSIGGRITKVGEFPHMGAVGWRALYGTWIFKCGSSLISSKFLLTAAHCSQVSSRDVDVANTKPEIVRLGDKNILDFVYNGQTPMDFRIQNIIVHPNFSPPKKYFDVAIIELEEQVPFDMNIQPACLWTRFDTTPLGNKASSTGWGVIETTSLRTSPELQAIEIDILHSDVCNNLLRPYCNRLWCGMLDHQICAGKLSGGVDACQGDSGGPLQVKINLPSNSQGSMYYLIGVTSFGIGCARSNTPAVYTRVSSFIEWIEDIVWNGVS